MRTPRRRWDDLAEEIEDRFGAPANAAQNLIALCRLRIACRRLGIAGVSAGPEAVALDRRDGGRTLLHLREANPERRLFKLLDMLREELTALAG